jgi:DNA-binding transcriptional MerR regulator
MSSPQPLEQSPDTSPEAVQPVSSSKQSKASKAPSAFRTISEVADGLGVQQHVLRFWETKFTQIRPLKRGGGRRYYRPEDVVLLEKIHHLLYTEGYTIKGVQKLLKGQGRGQAVAVPAAAPVPAKPASVEVAPAASKANLRERPGLSDRQRTILESMLGELKELRSMIKTK